MASYSYYDVKHPIGSEDYQQVFRLLEEALPPCERRSAESQKALLQLPPYHLMVRYGEDGAVEAFLAFWELERFDFVEHFAVSPLLRGKGIGQTMLDRLKARGRKLVLEVEPGETEIAKRRIHFYERCGFMLNLYEYEQPPLQPDFKPLPLLLMTFPAKLTQNEFAAVRDCLYHNVYHLTEQKTPVL